MIAKFAAWLLKRNLSPEDRSLLLTAVVNTIGAVPVKAIISVGENQQILVHGKPLALDQAIALRESAQAALNSYARALVHEQIRFAAVDAGFLKNESDDRYRSVFYKAALWFAQQENELLKALSPTDSTL